MNNFLGHVRDERSDSIEDVDEQVLEAFGAFASAPGRRMADKRSLIGQGPAQDEFDEELDDFDRSILEGNHVKGSWPVAATKVLSDRFTARGGRGAPAKDRHRASATVQGSPFFPTPCSGPSLPANVGLPVPPSTRPLMVPPRATRSGQEATNIGQLQRAGTAQEASAQDPGASQQLLLGHAPALVQGIELIFTDNLPDRFRSIFPFNPFNAVQSKCFDVVYKSDDNFVLAAPTGSGKTAVLELAICRLLSVQGNGQFKIVYQAPTKALCAERQRDWERKFAPLDLRCAELTGDTDLTHVRNVQNASVIITTPEKWDSVTRRWKDHAKLMQLVKLFLIDEVHILHDTRGATLETVVSRMKTVSSDVRFVALSATIPNLNDLALWLGRNALTPSLPACQERFGDDFRPVRLQKHVCGYKANINDFAFDKLCESKLPEIISKHSHRKPIMIFCCTRSSAISTAKFLANWGAAKDPRDRFWPIPTHSLGIHNQELRNCAGAGVAFHHGGLDISDRQTIERAYLQGQISVICCTSTLAVGVNLPCHMVVIKNTMNWQPGGLREYADLEIMQMLGRAGRPQFDSSAVAVIMTRAEKVKRYEAMVSGQEIIESRLHLNLIEHLNAEIGLGSIHDLDSAKTWLRSTFLYIRLAQNPKHYELDSDLHVTGVDKKLEQICTRDINLLQEAELVRPGPSLKCSEFGEAMSRYYVRYETMKVLGLKYQAAVSDILQCLARAEEFNVVRLKAAEKTLYKELNKTTGIRFPINVDLALTEHKVSLIVQAELGAVDLPLSEQHQKHRQQYHQDKGTIFQHVSRLIRCIVDCSIQRADSIAVKHGLELVRSFAARVWDGSPLELRQIEQIGPVAVRKLVAAGIDSIEGLRSTEAHRIEMVLSRHPPFGSKILAKVINFPRLKIAAKMTGKSVRAGGPVQVKVRAEIGFANEKPPTLFLGKPIFVCFVAETSDGHLAEFGRINARKLGSGETVMFEVPLIKADQHIIFSAMCDEIAGTLQQVDLKPELPLSLFPPVSRITTLSGPGHLRAPVERASALSKAQSQHDDRLPTQTQVAKDGSSNTNFEDDLFSAFDFDDIDDFTDEPVVQVSGSTQANQSLPGPASASNRSAPLQRTQLEGGKWACNHKCKDKTACKHLCCREGLDKPPKGLPKPNVQGATNTSQQPQGLIYAAKLACYKPVAEAYKAAAQPVTKRNGIEVLNMSGSEQNDNRNRSLGLPRLQFDLHKPHLDTSSDPEKRLLSGVHADALTPSSFPSVGELCSPSGRRNADNISSTPLVTCSSPHAAVEGRGGRTGDGDAWDLEDYLSDVEQELWTLDDSVAKRNMDRAKNDDHAAVESTQHPASAATKNTLYAYWSSSPAREASVIRETSPPRNGDSDVLADEQEASLLPGAAPEDSHEESRPTTGRQVDKRKPTPRPDSDDDLEGRKSKRPRPSRSSPTPLRELSNMPEASSESNHPKVADDHAQPKGLEGIDPDILAEFQDIVDFY